MKRNYYYKKMHKQDSKKILQSNQQDVGIFQHTVAYMSTVQTLKEL